MAKSKYPELEKMLASLEAERAKIAEQSDPLRKEREELRSKIAPFMDRIRLLDKAIHAAERPRMTEIDNQLAGIKKALAK